MKLALLNTTIATTDGIYEITTITTQQARELITTHQTESYIGHQGTAEVMSKLLQAEVVADRKQLTQQVGQTALVFKLNERVAEGVILTAKQLSELDFNFKTMTRIS